MVEITVRRLSAPEEFVEAVEVQKSAWRMNDYREAAPAHLLRGLADNGGLVLGAFAGRKMAGVSYGWPSGTYFYSHATGVAEDYKYRGVGFKLKAAQRREVLKMGMDLVKWTFDPLQSLNSRFNLNKLGVIAREYYINYYGEITDPINKGLGSDRVKAEWYITSPRVLKALREGLSLGHISNHCVALSSNGIKPGEPNLKCTSNIVIVEIPYSIDEVKRRSREIAIEWRRATRKVYDEYINNSNYILAFNYRYNERTFNVLIRGDLENILYHDIAISSR